MPAWSWVSFGGHRHERRANLDHRSRKIRYVPAYHGRYGQEARKLGSNAYIIALFTAYIARLALDALPGLGRMISATGPRSIQVG